MSLTKLPTEVIARVIGLTDSANVRRCSQVSRLFRSLVKNQARLQYMLELDVSGYALPFAPRTDIPYDEKIEILRERRKNRQKNDLFGPFLVSFSGKRAGHLCLVDGTVAFGSVDNPYSRPTRRISFHQLPSRNRGTDHKHWKHDFGFDVIAFAIHPDMDLFVVVEQISHEMMPRDCARFKVHLLTMSTCEPHPGVEPSDGSVLDVIDTLGVNGLHDSFVFRDIWVYGHLLAVTFEGYGHDARSYVLVRNWVLGKETARVEAQVINIQLEQESFSFVSKDYFVILSDSRLGSSRVDSNPLGYFDVYHINPAKPSTRLSPSQPIARLALPVLHDTNDLVVTELMSTRVLTTATSCRSAYPPPVPKVYELPSDGHILWLSTRIVAYLDIGSEIRGCGWTFVVSTLLADILNHRMKELAQPANEPYTIPVISWKLWRSCTRYVDRPHLSQTLGCLSGLLWSGVIDSEVTILDFSPRRLRVQEAQRDRPSEEEIVPPGTPKSNEESCAKDRPGALGQLFSEGSDAEHYPQYTWRTLTASRFSDYGDLYVLTDSEHVGAVVLDELLGSRRTSEKGLYAYEI